MKKHILCAALLTTAMALPLAANAETVRYNNDGRAVILHSEQQPIYHQRTEMRRDADHIGADGYNRYDNDVRSRDGSFAAAPTNDRTVAQALQQALKDSGFYKGAVNSRWDNESKDALASYQYSKGMPATGVLNQETVTRLGLVLSAADQVSTQSPKLANQREMADRRASDDKRIANKDSSYDRAMRQAEHNRAAYHTTYSNLNRDEVQVVQQELRESGFYRASVDGIWGPKTAQGVRDYQTANGLKATGKLNGATLDQLGLQVSETSQVTAVEPASGNGYGTRDTHKIMKRDARY